jgi:PPOX class probable F420-dependent enzyme
VDVEEAIAFIRQNHRGVLETTRSDGGAQLSPVAAAVDSDGRVVVSSRETAIKTLNLRKRPRASICVFTDNFYGPWCQVEGPTEIVSLPDAMDGLIEYYRSISGEHPDWDDYKRAMVEERRVVLRIAVDRAGPKISG